MSPSTTARADEHDHGVKSFLGASGAFNGQDVVRRIAAHPATARFICTRLFQFFVTDEADEASIAPLIRIFQDTDGDIRRVLRGLFLSATFRSAAVRFTKVKSPIELVFGLARLTATWDTPDHRLLELVEAASLMGQTPLYPPNVGGWTSGVGWLNGSCMLERVNTASRMVADLGTDGVRRMLREVESCSDGSDGGLLSACLLALGALEPPPATQDVLLEAAQTVNQRRSTDPHAVLHLLKLIAATPTFQYC